MGDIPPLVHQITFSNALTQSVNSQPLGTCGLSYSSPWAEDCTASCWPTGGLHWSSNLLKVPINCSSVVQCVSHLLPSLLTKEVYYIYMTPGSWEREWMSNAPVPSHWSLGLKLKRGVTCSASWTVPHPKSCMTVNVSHLWEDGKTEGLIFNNPFYFETLISFHTVLLLQTQLLQWQRAEYKKKEAKEKRNFCLRQKLENK